MVYGSFAAINTGTQVARKHLAQLEQEEEALAYTSDDLGGDWEFKIVRSSTAAFGRTEVFHKLIEEESRAGWIMLEKLDDSRVRFRRPRSARVKDTYLPPEVDPYRTQYGSDMQRTAVVLTMIGVAILLALGVVAFVMLTVAR
jgi:hypothetical protein